jgi:hypothetical protein
MGILNITVHKEQCVDKPPSFQISVKYIYTHNSQLGKLYNLNMSWGEDFKNYIFVSFRITWALENQPCRERSYEEPGEGLNRNGGHASHSTNRY